MFMLQKTDGSIGHGIVNIVLMFALCKYTPFVFIYFCIRRNNCCSFQYSIGFRGLRVLEIKKWQANVYGYLKQSYAQQQFNVDMDD